MAAEPDAGLCSAAGHGEHKHGCAKRSARRSILVFSNAVRTIERRRRAGSRPRTDTPGHVVDMCAEKESDVAFDNLQLRHAGGNFDSGSSDNQSTEVGAACCIGVDGGFLQMSSCSVSAVNGTGVGLTGMNSTALLKNCELANSSVGACACQAAKFGCGSSSFSNFSDAAVVLIGNKTLGELEGNTMDRCGILGISVSEGAGLIAEENSIAGCSRAGISVVGKSWARVTSNRIVNNGEHGTAFATFGIWA
eukprot:320342-Rhodomonas_salina.2